MREYRKAKEELNKMMDNYGVQFNMAVIYLMDAGWNNIEEINEDEFMEACKKEDKEIKARGNHPLCTPEFKLELLQLAKQIAKIISPWNLLVFAKDCMPIYTGGMDLKRACAIADNLISMVLEENMYDYDGEEDDFREHVMDYCDMVEEEWEQITGETIVDDEE